MNINKIIHNSREKSGSTVQIPCLNYPLFKWFDKWQIIKYTFKCNFLV